MKKRVISAVLALCLFTSGALAATGLQKVTAYLRSDISVVVDGQAQKFTDANGKTVYAISYNDTTYLPIRSIGGLMNKSVSWSESTKTITLTPNNAKKETFELGSGNYTVGADLVAGTYDVVAISGQGNFYGSVQAQMFGALNEIMAAKGSMFTGDNNAEYSNLKLATGDTFTISSGLRLKFVQK